MLKFEAIQELKPNKQIIEIIKCCKYEIKHGKVKSLLNTNLQFIEPTEYLITYPQTLTILEYKVNEVSNKPFYIKQHNEKYNIKEIIQRLIYYIEIKRDTNYEIEVTNIKFAEEFISKNTNKYLKYLMPFLKNLS